MSSNQILARAAAAGLEPDRWGSPLELGEREADGTLRAARFDHLSGFLVQAVALGEVCITDAEAAVALRNQHRDELRVCVALEAMLTDVGHRLDGAGIAWRATKGVALAHLDYSNPSVRTFGDVDIVLLPESWDAALNVFADAGLTRESSPLPAGYDRHFGKGATFRSASVLELDVHLRLAVGRFGVISSIEQLFADPEPFPLGGRSVNGLNGAGRLLHACYHATLGGYRRLRAFRDVAQLLLVSKVPWQDTFDVAQAWRGEAVVASAILETWDRLQLAAEHPALDRARATRIRRSERRALLHFTERSSFRRQALSALPVLPRKQVPRYLWSLASPVVRRRLGRSWH